MRTSVEYCLPVSTRCTYGAPLYENRPRGIVITVLPSCCLISTFTFLSSPVAVAVVSECVIPVISTSPYPFVIASEFVSMLATVVGNCSMI